MSKWAKFSILAVTGSGVGSGVAVGGTGVDVGGIGVAVAVGAPAAEVGDAVIAAGVAVGGTGVDVAGTAVDVDGTGVEVGAAVDVGAGVGFAVAVAAVAAAGAGTDPPAATTVRVAVMATPWTLQKYGKDPTSSKVKENESPCCRIGLSQASVWAVYRQHIWDS